MLLLKLLFPEPCVYAGAQFSIVAAGPVSPLDSGTVLVIFSQPLDASSAENPDPDEGTLLLKLKAAKNSQVKGVW